MILLLFLLLLRLERPLLRRLVGFVVRLRLRPVWPRLDERLRLLDLRDRLDERLRLLDLRERLYERLRLLRLRDV